MQLESLPRPCHEEERKDDFVSWKDWKLFFFFFLSHFPFFRSFIDWDQNDEDKDDSHQWEDDWDDDNVEDDFSKQLRFSFSLFSSFLSKDLNYDAFLPFLS